MAELIDNLRTEYYTQSEIITKATDRRDKIIALLESLEVGIPEPIYIQESEVDPVLAAVGLDKSYPSKGTVKDKISFLLNIKRSEEFTVIELVDRTIKLYEPDGNRKKLLKAFTQTCSNMAIDGDINVVKGYRNKYSYKKK